MSKNTRTEFNRWRTQKGLRMAQNRERRRFFVRINHKLNYLLLFRRASAICCCCCFFICFFFLQSYHLGHSHVHHQCEKVNIFKGNLFGINAHKVLYVGAVDIWHAFIIEIHLINYKLCATTQIDCDKPNTTIQTLWNITRGKRSWVAGMFLFLEIMSFVCVCVCA